MLSIMGKWKYSHTQKPHDFYTKESSFDSAHADFCRLMITIELNEWNVTMQSTLVGYTKSFRKWPYILLYTTSSAVKQIIFLLLHFAMSFCFDTLLKWWTITLYPSPFFSTHNPPLKSKLWQNLFPNLFC